MFTLPRSLETDCTRERTYPRRDFSARPGALSQRKLAESFARELLIEDGGKICGGGEPSRSPAALNSTLSLLPPAFSPSPPERDREKIYGHANYPLKLRETSPRPFRTRRHCGELSKFGP